MLYLQGSKEDLTDIKGKWRRPESVRMRREKVLNGEV
jgi:hypothetical protein